MLTPCFSTSGCSQFFNALLQNTKETKVVIVVGTGKLARELLSVLPSTSSIKVAAWADAVKSEEKSVVVHAGSGRELEDVITYCQETGSTLVELATGSGIESREVNFPVVVCPNTNILMLKFLAMLAASGHHFKNYKVSVIESHQAEKSSVPGTAVALAQSLGLPSSKILSIRDPREQRDALKIPPEYLARHAYHRVEIEDNVGRIVLETKVFGPAPYAEGLAQIISTVRSNKLENRRYNIMEFIENGWV
jgi:dihydrodipicolinate reductase